MERQFGIYAQQYGAMDLVAWPYATKQEATDVAVEDYGPADWAVREITGLTHEQAAGLEEERSARFEAAWQAAIEYLIGVYSVEETNIPAVVSQTAGNAAMWQDATLASVEQAILRTVCGQSMTAEQVATVAAAALAAADAVGRTVAQ